MIVPPVARFSRQHHSLKCCGGIQVAAIQRKRSENGPLPLSAFPLDRKTIVLVMKDRSYKRIDLVNSCSSLMFGHGFSYSTSTEESAAVAPQGEARSDFDVCKALAERMGGAAHDAGVIHTAEHSVTGRSLERGLGIFELGILDRENRELHLDQRVSGTNRNPM